MGTRILGLVFQQFRAVRVGKLPNFFVNKLKGIATGKKMANENCKLMLEVIVVRTYILDPNALAVNKRSF